ncbi:MAG: hypothetical protein LUO88_00445, partial [Methanoregulaceae archaeon]|nr:hypothetical protein [Methanoregulaceae archaeon]
REELIGRHFEDLPFPLFQEQEFKKILNSTLQGERDSRKVPVLYKNRNIEIAVTAIPTVFFDGTRGAAILIGDPRNQASW